MAWNTDVNELAATVAEFERRLPGFWWSLGMCNVGAHASCGVDNKTEWGYLVANLKHGVDDPLDSGFHCDTDKGTPIDALRDVMLQALADPRVPQL